MFTRPEVRVQSADWAAGPYEFRRGWIAANQPLTHDVLETWSSAKVGPLELRVHPAQSWASATRGPLEVVFIGDPVDIAAGTINAGHIARNVWRVLRRQGIESAVRHIAYLGGRFVSVLHHRGTTIVVPDTVGAVPVYWHGDAKFLTMSSHLSLIAEITGAPADGEAAHMWRRIGEERRSGGVVFWPGAETPIRGVHPVIPNHTLAWRHGERPAHRRFYPFPDTDFSDRRKEHDFVDLFETHTRLLCELGRVGISLTGGVDSRAAFAAALPHLPPDALAWTYYRRNHEGMESDLKAARRLAAAYPVEHRGVDLAVPRDEPFMAAYSRTMKHVKQMASLVNAYRRQVPEDVVELQSMVAEVGTGFYKRRTQDPPDAARLALLYASRDRHGSLPEVHAAMERFIDYADFRPERFGPIDYHDLLYWEVRMGRWASLRMQEVDMTHRLVLPYNHRGIIESLQAAPFEERVEKPILANFVSSRLRA